MLPFRYRLRAARAPALTPPPQLVGELIKSALDTVMAHRLSSLKGKRSEAKGDYCRSGSATQLAVRATSCWPTARRLGRELARVDTGEDEPAPERVREAIREVVCHCIYGVDKNPLAVDLCRVALWLESHTADKPLTFLDHRIPAR